MNFVDDSAALFPTMARVNHACRPNADFITRKFLGLQDLVATKFIGQGTYILTRPVINFVLLKYPVHF